MDLKDIKEAVQDAVQLSEKNWQSEREADKKSFDEKILKATDAIDLAQKEAAKLKEQFEQSQLEAKNKFKQAEKPVGFKKAMSNAIKDNYESINDVTKIKGSQIIQLKDIDYDGNFPDFVDWRTDFRNDIVMIDRDMFHLRDIIPLASTVKDTIKYPREGAKTGTGPAPWERAATIAATDEKPEFEPNLSIETATVEWIAGIMRLPVEMLSDMPFLTSYLQNFARMELLEAEDNQLLNGTGVSPQLDGLIPNATAYDGSYTVLVEKIIDANLRQLGALNTAGTDVILNPAQIVEIILNKAAGSGEYDNPAGVVGYVNGQLQIAGLNVRKTNKIADGDFLVGNFNHSQIAQRLAPQLRFFEQDRDNVVKNLVTVRIEERLALLILKESFIYNQATT